MRTDEDVGHYHASRPLSPLRACSTGDARNATCPNRRDFRPKLRKPDPPPEGARLRYRPARSATCLWQGDGRDAITRSAPGRLNSGNQSNFDQSGVSFKLNSFGKVKIRQSNRAEIGESASGEFVP